jgi:uncharacterized protein YjbI with pentapeptide repeats
MKIVNGYEIKPGVDLSGADLLDADLSGANLTKADLRDANLTKAIFTVQISPMPISVT